MVQLQPLRVFDAHLLEDCCKATGLLGDGESFDKSMPQSTICLDLKNGETLVVNLLPIFATQKISKSNIIMMAVMFKFN